MQAGKKSLPPHCAKVGLVLQGGGALGAYQAGVYATLSERGYDPDWISGVSIGAVNGALIAGNPPERRTERLRQFWELVTDGISVKPLLDGDMARGVFNEWSALASIASGVRGFFLPRMPSAWLQPWGTEGALSFYDTAPLRETLEQLVDFDLLNAGTSAPQRRRGQYPQGQLGVFRHARAADRSGAHHGERGPAARLPAHPDRRRALLGRRRRHQHAAAVPARRASATPACWCSRSTCSARGARCPTTCSASTSARRTSSIRPARASTPTWRAHEQELRRAIERLLEKLPAEFEDDADVRYIRERCVRHTFMSVVHLIYREKNYETQTKDYEFSRVSMEEHWLAGVNDTRRTLQHEREWLAPPDDLEGVRTFDITRDFD